jgi:hypothetical protein
MTPGSRLASADVCPALTTCIGCPVRRSCLAQALEADGRYGVWGGTTECARHYLRLDLAERASIDAVLGCVPIRLVGGHRHECRGRIRTRVLSRFGEDAPLDLPTNLPDAALAGMVARLVDGTADSFGDAMASVNNCARPVRLVRHSTTIDSRSVLDPCGVASDPRKDHPSTAEHQARDLTAPAGHCFSPVDSCAQARLTSSEAWPRIDCRTCEEGPRRPGREVDPCENSL